MEAKVKEQVERRNELSQWGFNSHVISYRIKVRMMEDIIDKAQRYRLQPNADLEFEMWKMKILRDQTFEDLESIMNRKNLHVHTAQLHRSYHPGYHKVMVETELLKEQIKAGRERINELFSDQQHMEMISNAAME